MEKNTYKESKYNFKLITEDKKMLMYNSRTGAICSIKAENKETIEEILNNPHEDINKEFFHGLLNMGFLVEESLDEVQEIKDLYDKNRNDKRKVSLVMLPAEACNFSCPYCFIYEQRNMYMEDWVYDGVYKYIEKKAIDNLGETTYVGLAWFGGEPLLSSNKIIEFMGKVNSLKEKYDLNIDSGIVSNGYLLNLELFKKLLEAGIFTYNITIDGDEETHNITRRLKTGQDTFKEIYNNFKSISENIPKDVKFNFIIRVNFLKNSLNKMEKFIEVLRRDFGEDNRFKLFFKPIYNIETSRNDIESISSDVYSGKEAFDNQMKLAYRTMDAKMESFNDMNVANPLPQPNFTWCETVQPYTHIVGADGSIFSCDTLMVDKEHRAGVITKEGDIILNDIGHEWKKSIFDEDNDAIKKCVQCKLLPVCMGGCKRGRMETGQSGCHWTEENIYKTMEMYVKKKMEIKQ